MSHHAPGTSRWYRDSASRVAASQCVKLTPYANAGCIANASDSPCTRACGLTHGLGSNGNASLSLAHARLHAWLSYSRAHLHPQNACEAAARAQRIQCPARGSHHVGPQLPTGRPLLIQVGAAARRRHQPHLQPHSKTQPHRSKAVHAWLVTRLPGGAARVHAVGARTHPWRCAGLQQHARKGHVGPTRVGVLVPAHMQVHVGRCVLPTAA